MQASTDCDDEGELSQYEKERLRKIEENRALMMELNLFEAKELLSMKSHKTPNLKARWDSVHGYIFCGIQSFMGLTCEN